MKQVIFCLLICGILSSVGVCQESPSIKLLAKVKSKSILLRWAPTDPLTWGYANDNGYQIERYTIARGNNLLPKPEKVILNQGPFKPKPLEQWKTDALKNNFSAIAAQAIYGKSFQVTMPNSNNLTDIVNKSREQEQRFSFALFAADQSFETAKLSGLALRDSTVKKDERYLYRVFVLMKDPKIKIDTALYYIGLRDSVGLTPPVNVQAKFGDRTVELRWPKFAVDKEYISFVVERAEAKDAVFKKIRSLPFINPINKDENFFQAVDSLPQNGVEYLYRVRGVTPFGEIGPESERVSGVGFKELRGSASIKSAKEEKEKIAIRWEVTGDPLSIVGFYVERSKTVSGAFTQLNKNKLDPSVLNYLDAQPQSASYYRIKVIGENGQENFSFPYLAQLADSVPPAPPKGLKVLIDTTGVARLSWTPNKESDLLGYRVYRSNFASSEYSQINKDPSLASTYRDSINIRRLNSKIYYKLVAVDRRFNPSEYSLPVTVELPDVIPPLPPVIESIKSTPTGVKIEWTQSASDDVVAYKLLRRIKNAVKWDTIYSAKAQDSLCYTDKNLDNKIEYQYCLVATDKSNLRSPLSTPAFGKAINTGIKPAMKEITFEIDRTEKSITLRWKYTEKDVTKYLIYRATESPLSSGEGKGVRSEPLTLYKSVAGNSFGMKDVNLIINTKYKYRVKAVFKDGGESGFSEEKIVNF